jgi:polyphenol oxidase
MRSDLRTRRSEPGDVVRAEWTTGRSPALAWPGLEQLGVDAEVTTRDGGVSNGPYATLNLALHVGDDPGSVVENRRRAAAWLGAPGDDLVVAEQVHGNQAVVVGHADRGRGARDLASAVAGADALVTSEPGLVLTVLVADCTPILIVDPQARVLAGVHAGWRGTTGRVVDTAVAAMSDLDAVPERMTAIVGPAISSASYQVDRPVADAVHRCFPIGPPPLEPDGENRWKLDLHEANRRILVEAGLPPDRVMVSQLSSDDPRFFSHRRAGGRPCGRFALLARLAP